MDLEISDSHERVETAAGASRSADGEPLEVQIAVIGDALLNSLRNVLAGVPRSSPGPQALARTLGVDKVLASRVLKATRSRDPMTATHCMPGPDPLRRLVKAASKRGAPPESILQATLAIDQFEQLIRERVGDRSLLDAILSAWVPDARREFELRRKQAAFKAMSQLRGVQADIILATAIINPSPDGRHNDVVWINGLIGVHRVRPGVHLKVSTRRMTRADGEEARRPVSIDGKSVEDLGSLQLPAFSSDPMPRLQVQRAGEVMHYMLAEDGFGASSSVDVVFAEANMAELPRRVPAGSNRKSYFFAENVTPARLLHFDVLVHEDLYTGALPELRIYDTSFEGVASPNNPSRDMDQMDMMESLDSLGVGSSRFRSMDVPRYGELVRHVFEKMGFNGARFRGYRCRIDYPVYGSQVMALFLPEHEG
jgi:hypothetical protein